MSRDQYPVVARVAGFVTSNPYRILAAGVAALAGLAVFVIAHDVFPFHSANHDEGVYLQQAAMLLEGQLSITPGSEALRAAVHPWFFVDGDVGLFPKYGPVPAAMFAVGLLVGDPRLALGAIAAVNVGLGYTLATAAFDRRTGAVAATTMATAPLFLLTSSVFLPYAPTAALNLLFAVAYVRSVRRADPRWAVVAGAAIGLAFFARPYTAVLFASPFVAHALWRLSRAYPPDRSVFVQYGLVSGVAMVFVGVTLAYNAVLTGSPFLFPYEAFAPRDGLGFGRRAILGYELMYTPDLAVRANVLVLWTFATAWFAAGALGISLAAVGLVAVVVSFRRHGPDPSAPLRSRQLQLVLLGVVLTVVIGNVLFWGNRNILGDLTTADDGLISLFGPFYHFDLLLPLSAFAAHGLVTTVDELRAWVRGRTRFIQLSVALMLVVAGSAVVAVEADALRTPLERNAVYTEKYDRAYEPFTTNELANALVFLPPAYGEWRNHPFQWLRNAPRLDGPTVYVLSRNPADDFAILDAYPGRAYYRYRYHGEWTPDPTRQVYPVFDRVQLVDGSAVTARTSVAVPDRIVGVTVAVTAGATVHRYDLDGQPPGRLTVEWTLTPAGVTVDHPNLTPRHSNGPVPVPLDGPQEVAFTVTITEPEGTTLTYRETVLARPNAVGVEVLWPPASSACPLVTDCGLSGTYVPHRPETRPAGIAMNTTLAEVDQ